MFCLRHPWTRVVCKLARQAKGVMSWTSFARSLRRRFRSIFGGNNAATSKLAGCNGQKEFRIRVREECRNADGTVLLPNGSQRWARYRKGTQPAGMQTPSVRVSAHTRFSSANPKNRCRGRHSRTKKKCLHLCQNSPLCAPQLIIIAKRRSSAMRRRRRASVQLTGDLKRKHASSSLGRADVN